MGKGYKRKTRWRTLNIAAPTGEEDDEDGIRDGKTRENGTRNIQHNSHTVNHKQIHNRSDTRNDNGITTGDSTGASPSRSQPKIIFDENEYTRITTPRQDVLFKKGYFARKKVWTSNNASTSATPSTTESQSASHSTADGSETTEDLQLLDCRDSGLEEYPPMTEQSAQMSYGTFYDPSSGYYYEYPVMVVGPPMPGPPMHNLLAAMPCEAVPLRPIEWVNPAYVPKLEQPYCLIDYQNQQVGQFPNVEENDVGQAQQVTSTNSNYEPMENGNASWTYSIGGEEQQDDEEQQQQQQQQQEQSNGQVEATTNGDTVPETTFPPEPCLETVLAQQLHVSHPVVPPQPYMYPGYMFGPTLINVNGMTIQSGQMVRTTEITAGASMCAKRRKKKKLSRRKPRRPIGQDNIEDYGLEEEDYSSEADNVNLVSAPFVPSNCPLNPDCKEFQLRSTTISAAAVSPTIISDTMKGDHETEPSDTITNQELSNDTTIQDLNDSLTESPVVTDVEYATEAITTELNHQIDEIIHETEIGVDVTCKEFTEIVEKLETPKELTNGLCNSLEESMETIVSNGGEHEEDYEKLSNGGLNELPQSPDPKTETISLKILGKTSANGTRKKYKSTKIIREPTPGPEFDDNKLDGKIDGIDIEVTMGIEAIEAQVPRSSVSTLDSYSCDKLDNHVNDVSNDDSGFESQTRFTEHPITEAVTQWLKRANSPDLFVGLKINESDDENDEPDDIEPSKNLQGNPMPALSANSVVINVAKTLSRPACEFVTRRKKRLTGKRKNLRKSCKQFNSNNCEFTDKDSTAGMRVAEYTRKNDDNDDDNDNDNGIIIDDKRTNEFNKSSRENEMKIICNVNDVKTYEQGEIVVTIDGKLLPSSIYGGLRCDNNNDDGIIEQKSEIQSIGSIEEPDVMEYWDAETIEPILNSKKLSEKKENYENFDNNEEIDPAGLELVRKYYRLGRNSVQSTISIDDNDNNSIINSSRLSSPGVINDIHDGIIDEGIEIYESYYSGKLPIFIDSDFKKSRILRADEDGPIPCRAACCNVQ